MFSYFLIGLICLYLIYYAVIISYDINKKNKKKEDEGEEDFTSIVIDEEEFSPKSAKDVYDAYETEENPKTTVLDVPKVSSDEVNNRSEHNSEPIQITDESESNDSSEQVAEKQDDDDDTIAKYNSNLTNHGGMSVPDIKSLIKEAYDEENMFASITSQFN